ncbi:MAG: hypothetical protein NT029_13860 [Armatimonadetes bacterium]|nr:hypothetical protein [Armatimonadota bacterium]
MGGSGLVDGVGSSARFGSPWSAHLYTSAGGTETLFVVDAGNYTIRRIDDPAGGSALVTTIAGDGVYGNNDGPGSSARFAGLRSLAAASSSDGGLDLFVADYTRLRTIHLPGGAEPRSKASYRVDTLAGDVSGYADGDGTTARFAYLFGVAARAGAGGSSTLYLADYLGMRIRMASAPAGVFHSGGSGGASSDPVSMLNYDAEATNRAAYVKQMAGGGGAYSADLQFQIPSGVSGFSFLATIETDSDVVNLPAGGSLTITTLAGTGHSGYRDGEGKLAEFAGPTGIVAVPDSMRSLYRSGTGRPIRAFVVDRDGGAIRTIDTAGSVGTFAGGVAGFSDGIGASARFSDPTSLALGPDGALWIADTSNQRIRCLLPNGTVYTVAGTGAHGSADGRGNVATLAAPAAIAVDSGGQVFFTGHDHTVRRIRYVSGDVRSSASYEVVTVAGAVNQTGLLDGVGAAARFNNATGLAADRDGRVYVADYGNDAIRVLRSTSLTEMSVTTLAAGMPGPFTVAVNAAHELYVGLASQIRRVSPAGVSVILVSGPGFTDGANGTVGNLRSISLEESGTALFCDGSNFAVRALQRVVDTSPLP